MEQLALVEKRIDERTVLVRSMLSENCAHDCNTCHICNINDETRVKAYDDIGVKAGELVYIESSSARTLMYIGVILVVPLVILAIAYLVCSNCGASSELETIVSVVSYLASLIISAIVIRKMSKRITFVIKSRFKYTPVR